DAHTDSLNLSSWNCFEIEDLMRRKEEIKLPVLLYLFHVIERRLNGQPTLLMLDDAWLMLSHPVFRDKITAWFKVLRKANCTVVLATQEIADAISSGMLSTLTESCPT